ncbi:MAG: hypothetical protein BV456_01010 [Thermoplasmata archaeon M8B2D]|nr:MAG: hypothetical protein BV456_01010 [Thermoplasmata archaeon M8B2D]
MDISLIDFTENKNTFFDIEYQDNGDFKQDDLDTSIVIGLFADTRAEEDEVLVAEQRRGFWGKEIDGSNTGSKIWQQNGRKIIDNMGRIIDWAEKGLQFLTDEELVKKVESNAVFTENGVALNNDITKLDNSELTKNYII